MAKLRIDLAAGFDGERVRIRMNGREVYAREGVRTDYSVGLADSFEVERGAAAVQITLELPDRGAADTAEVAADRAAVAFTVGPDGGISHEVSPDVFRYF